MKQIVSDRRALHRIPELDKNLPRSKSPNQTYKPSTTTAPKAIQPKNVQHAQRSVI